MIKNADDSEFINSIRVLSGNPTDSELAAVAAILLEAGKQQQSTLQPQRSTWAKNSSRLRTGIVVGNGQWGSQYRQGL